MSHDVDVLNLLIARLRGASTAYRKAAADGAELSDAFGGAAESHDRTAEALGAVVRAASGEPAAATGLDPAHRAWTDLPRAAAAGPHAVAEAVEHAEVELVRTFQAAMDDARVSGPIRDAVVRAFDGVKAGHDRALQRLDALGR